MERSMSMKKPVLVTGAAGLVGNEVCAILRKRGDQVIGIDRQSAENTSGPIIVCDLGDIHRLHELSREGVQAVIHCAAHSGPMVARDNPYSMVQVNILGTANMLEIARIHGARRFVYCSSTTAYGPTPPGPVPEDVALKPTNVYGASKVASEQLVSAYATQYGLDGVSLRLSWVYGPRRTTDCAIRTMITDAQAGRPTRIAFGRDFPRQYIYVSDAASALVAALDAQKLPRRIYNVTGGSFKTLGEIAEVVSGILPHTNISLGDSPDPVDDLQYEFDTSAARNDLGIRPQYDLERGIRDYSAWLSSHSSS
jgi:UDP-glucuronate 4-epimerase